MPTKKVASLIRGNTPANVLGAVVAFARRRKISILMMAVGMLAFGYGTAQEAATGKTSTIERKSQSPHAEKETNKFKTRKGRLEAKPLDWNSTIGKPEKSSGQSGVDEQRAQGEQPGSSVGGAPNPKAKRDARKRYPQDWRGIREPAKRDTLGLIYGDEDGRFLRVAGSPDIFTQYCENCPNVNTDSPEIAIGKLFSNAGTCSASVISGNNVIVTAAHCCYDRSSKNWIGGWSFAPAYHNGNAPYGTFDWSSATVLNSWINNGDIPSDVCLINLQNDSNGRGITYYTGWLGRSWDWPSDQEHHALGYPGNLGNANVLELCTSESFSPSSQCGGDGILNTGCSMTYGSSGGPWIRNYRSDNWVNSVVHGYDSQSCTGSFGKTFNGARFTSGNIVTLCNAAGC